MNLTFTITKQYEKEFVSSNLINSNLRIERVSICCGSDDLGTCLLLDTINNMQERRQSPLVVINKKFQSDYVNITIPKTRKWRFYLTDKEGKYKSVHTPIVVSIHFSVDT